MDYTMGLRSWQGGVSTPHRAPHRIRTFYRIPSRTVLLLVKKLTITRTSIKANVKHLVHTVTSTPNLGPAKTILHSHTPSPARSPIMASITCRTRCAIWSRPQATTAPRRQLRGIQHSTLHLQNRRLWLRLRQCGRVLWIGAVVRSERPSITPGIRMRRRSGMGRKCGCGGVGALTGVWMVVDWIVCEGLFSHLGDCCICVQRPVCAPSPALSLGDVTNVDLWQHVEK